MAKRTVRRSTSTSTSLDGIPADKAAASPDKGGPSTSRATASSRRKRGTSTSTSTSSSSPNADTAGALQDQLKAVLEAQESDVPLELRVRAEQVIAELGGLTPPKAVNVAIDAIRARPFLGKTAFLFNARDEDYPVTYDSKTYVLPAGKVTEVPGAVAQAVGPGTGHAHYGVVQIFYDSTDATAKRNAREAYMQWLAREVSVKVRKYRDDRDAALQAGRHAPAPDPDTAFFMLKAKQYQNELVAP